MIDVGIVDAIGEAVNISILRESEEIFVAKSDSPYWSDGSAIDERLAFSDSGILSNSKAQSIDRANGNGYILVSPFGIKSPIVVERSRKLAIGESFTFEAAIVPRISCNNPTNS